VLIDSSAGRPPSRAIIAITITFLIIIWAVNFLVGKITLRYIEPLALASFRLVLAGILMLALYPLCLRLPAFAEARHARLQSKSWRDLWTFTYLGFFGVAVNQLCFTIGLRYTSVTHSAIIVGMAPIYTLLLAVLFRLEDATLRKVLGMAVSLTGVALMASETGLNRRSPTLLGDIITLTGSLGFATYVVLGKRVAPRYDALTMTTYNFVIGAILILPLAIQRALVLGPLANWRAIHWQAWAGMLFMALFSSSLAYLFYYWILRYLQASQLAAFSYLLPVTATALGIVFLGERGSWLELFGAALALAGVFYIESARSS
jgi:drug/metabolite transporter (DMT)-like permease